MSTWLDLLLRSAAILAAGEAIRRLCSKAPARFRYQVVLLAIIAVLLLPVLSAILPDIPVRLWHHSAARANVNVQAVSIGIEDGRSPSPAVNWWLLCWCLGFCLSLAPLIAGSLSISRIARSASPLRDPAWNTLLHDLSRTLGLRKLPPIVVSDQIAVPLTFGPLKPKILLPSTCHEWNATGRRAVLLHELAHVRRRDLLSQFCAYLIAAVWWFQPLAWLLLRSLRHESELACDAETVASGIEPSSYASELLKIAKAIGGSISIDKQHAWSGTAVSIGHPHQFERRMKAVLSQAVPRLSRARRLFLLASLCLVTMAASAVTLVSQNSQNGGVHMKRTLISSLLTSLSLSAATVSGSLFDPSGAAIPNARVLLYSPDTGAKQETTTGADGHFALEDAPAGDSILRIEKPGFNAILREFSLKADSKIEKGLTMQTQKAGPTSPSEPIRVGGRIAQANLVTRIQPVYPAAAKEARVQGTVEMEVVISAEGVPLDIRVVSSPSDDLSESSLQAVRQWRYHPTLLNGNPVAIVTEVIVNYTLAP